MDNQTPVTLLNPKSIKLLKGNRQGRDAQRYEQMKRSMDTHGLINPVLVREDPHAKDRYLCIAGEQRIHAAIDLGWPQIAARVIPDPGDADARDLQLIENLHRADLTPWEEAEQLAYLQKLAGDCAIELLAERVGKSTVWVAQRLAFNKLIPRLRDLVQSQDWPLSHLPLLARFPESGVQADICNGIEENQKNHHGWSHYDGQKKKSVPAVPTLRELQEFLDDYHHHLSGAIWKLDDADLVTKAGSCSKCQKRSSARPMLFPEIKDAKLDRCLDSVCWGEKQAAMVELQVDKIKEKGRKPLFMTEGYQNVDPAIKRKLNNPQTVQHWNYSPCKESDKGAQPAVIIGGNGIGQVKYVRPVSRGSSETKKTPRAVDQETGKPKPPSKQARLNTLRCKRQALAVRKWMGLLESRKPSLAMVLPIVAIIGTDGHNNWCNQPDWKEVTKVAGYDAEAMAKQLWESVYPVLEDRCRINGPVEKLAPERWEEAVSQAHAIGDHPDLLTCYAEAIQEIKLSRVLTSEGVTDPGMSDVAAKPQKQKKAKVK